jgi:hypothetical protein
MVESVRSGKSLVRKNKVTKKSMQRALILFDNTLKSQKTMGAYLGYLAEFKKFCWVK